MIHKKASSYIQILLLLGTLLSPTIMYSSADSSKEQDRSNAQAKNIMHGIYISHLSNLLISAEYLCHILKLEPKSFSDAIQRIKDPSKRELVKENCKELATLADNLRKNCKDLLSLATNQHSIDKKEVLDVTIGLLRLYKATEKGLDKNFLKNKTKDDAPITNQDKEAAKIEKFLDEEGRLYGEALQKASPGDTDLLDKLLAGFGRSTQIPFSRDQQITLQKLTSANLNLVILKRNVDVLMKDFGLGWKGRQASKLHAAGVTIKDSWEHSPNFRLWAKLIGFSIYSIGWFSIKSWVKGPWAAGIEAYEGFKEELKTINYYRRVGIGQTIGNRIADETINTIKEGGDAVFEQAAKIGQVAGYDNIMGHTRQGGVIRKIIPQESMVNNIMIDHECDAAIRLFEDMLRAHVFQGPAERLSNFKDRRKSFAFKGPTGAGKTQCATYVVNECAKLARVYGLEIYEVHLGPKSIEANEMEWIRKQLLNENPNAIIFFNFGEFQHAKPSQEGNADSYGRLLDFWETINQKGDSCISLGTTNQLELPADLQRRLVIIDVPYPTRDKRKKLFEKLLKNLLYNDYAQQEINQFVSLTEGANMDQLRTIVTNLVADRLTTGPSQPNKLTKLSPEIIKTEILHIVHGLKKDHDSLQQKANKADLMHLAGQFIIAFEHASTEDRNNFFNGSSIIIASAQNFTKKSKQDSLQTFTRPGLLIQASANEKLNNRKKAKILLAGSVAQEFMIKNPEEYDTDLQEKDYAEALEICRKYTLRGRDLKQMSAKQKDKFYEDSEAEVETLKAEVREQLHKSRADLLQTYTYIAQRGQITALNYLALKEAEKQKAAGAGNDKKPVQAQRNTGQPTRQHMHAAAAAAGANKKS